MHMLRILNIMCVYCAKLRLTGWLAACELHSFTKSKHVPDISLSRCSLYKCYLYPQSVIGDRPMCLLRVLVPLIAS